MASTTTPLDLCHKLIALATNNPNEEEAKLAALKAVKLIKQHNLLPGATSVSRRPMSPPPTPGQRPPMSEQEYWYRRATEPPPRRPGEWGQRPDPRAKDPYGDPLYDDFFGDMKKKVEQEQERQWEKARQREAQAADETFRQEEKRKRGQAQNEAEARNREKRQRWSEVKQEYQGYKWMDFDFETKPDTQGHTFGLGNVCTQCKIGRDLFDMTGINCHGYESAKEGARRSGPNVPFEVQQELDRMMRQDPVNAAKMKAFLDSLYKNR